MADRARVFIAVLLCLALVGPSMAVAGPFGRDLGGLGNLGGLGGMDESGAGGDCEVPDDCTTGNCKNGV